MYVALLNMCLEEPNCNAYMFWGYTDKYTWLADGMNGLPWDLDYKPKDTVAAMIKTLKNFDRSHSGL